MIVKHIIISPLRWRERRFCFSHVYSSVHNKIVIGITGMQPKIVVPRLHKYRFHICTKHASCLPTSFLTFMVIWKTVRHIVWSSRMFTHIETILLLNGWTENVDLYLAFVVIEQGWSWNLWDATPNRIRAICIKNHIWKCLVLNTCCWAFVSGILAIFVQDNVFSLCHYKLPQRKILCAMFCWNWTSKYGEYKNINTF